MNLLSRRLWHERTQRELAYQYGYRDAARGRPKRQPLTNVENYERGYKDGTAELQSQHIPVYRPEIREQT
jgi:hypothetical protein